MEIIIDKNDKLQFKEIKNNIKYRAKFSIFTPKSSGVMFPWLKNDGGRQIVESLTPPFKSKNAFKKSIPEIQTSNSPARQYQFEKYTNPHRSPSRLKPQYEHHSGSPAPVEDRYSPEGIRMTIARVNGKNRHEDELYSSALEKDLSHYPYATSNIVVNKSPYVEKKKASGIGKSSKISPSVLESHPIHNRRKKQTQREKRPKKTLERDSSNPLLKANEELEKKLDIMHVYLLSRGKTNFDSFGSPSKTGTHDKLKGVSSDESKEKFYSKYFTTELSRGDKQSSFLDRKESLDSLNKRSIHNGGLKMNDYIKEILDPQTGKIPPNDSDKREKISQTPLMGYSEGEYRKKQFQDQYRSYLRNINTSKDATATISSTHIMKNQSVPRQLEFLDKIQDKKEKGKEKEKDEIQTRIDKLEEMFSLNNSDDQIQKYSQKDEPRLEKRDGSVSDLIHASNVKYNKYLLQQKQDYLKQLQSQIKEHQEKKFMEKEFEKAELKKLDSEKNFFSYFGQGGGGAPLIKAEQRFQNALNSSFDEYPFGREDNNTKLQIKRVFQQELKQQIQDNEERRREEKKKRFIMEEMEEERVKNQLRQMQQDYRKDIETKRRKEEEATYKRELVAKERKRKKSQLENRRREEGKRKEEEKKRRIPSKESRPSPEGSNFNITNNASNLPSIEENQSKKQISLLHNFSQMKKNDSFNNEGKTESTFRELEKIKEEIQKGGKEKSQRHNKNRLSDITPTPKFTTLSSTITQINKNLSKTNQDYSENNPSFEDYEKLTQVHLQLEKINKRLQQKDDSNYLQYSSLLQNNKSSPPKNIGAKKIPIMHSEYGDPYQSNIQLDSANNWITNDAVSSETLLSTKSLAHNSKFIELPKIKQDS